MTPWFLHAAMSPDPTVSLSALDRCSRFTVRNTSLTLSKHKREWGGKKKHDCTYPSRGSKKAHSDSFLDLLQIKKKKNISATLLCAWASKSRVRRGQSQMELERLHRWVYPLACSWMITGIWVEQNRWCSHDSQTDLNIQVCSLFG